MTLPKVRLPAAVDRFDARFDALWEPLRSSKLLNRVNHTASEVGDFGMLWLAIGSATAALGPAEQTRAALRLALALGVESIVVNGVIKPVFRRDRPSWEGERPIPLRTPKTSSFPSGHSSSAVTAAILLSDTAPSFTVLWTALAGLVATSRVHVKIHHVSDVVGGIVVGALYAEAVKRLFPL